MNEPITFPRTTSTRVLLEERLRDALPATPDGGPWEDALIAGLEAAIRLVPHHAITSSELDRLNAVRGIAANYRDAQRRMEARR